MAEREHFRMLMRMFEKFTGCRVLSYDLMSKHFHVLLDVPPMPQGRILDDESVQRLSGFDGEAQVAEICQKMKDAVATSARVEFELPLVDEAGVSLTPEQAEIVEDSADYQWSSYSEVI